MPRWITLLACCSIALTAAMHTGCRRETRELNRTLDFDSFRPTYNRYIHQWLTEQKAASLREQTTLEEEIAKTEGDRKPLLESQLAAVRTDLEKWDYRLRLGDYLKLGDPSEIPADLTWENGMDQPEIGDPRATKGGVFRRYIASFPPTLRPIGDNSNHGFRGDIYDDIDLGLVSLHPETMQAIPGVAREWAISPDGRTVYFRLDPEARYSDGSAVRARDFHIAAYISVSDYISNPYQKQYFREEIAQIAVYDDLTLSISLPEPRVYAPLLAGSFTPVPPGFYEEYGPDFNERYQWRYRPTTGAYEVRPEDIVKGASITQTRVKDWWAKDRKYYRYRFNPDKIVSTVVRDESKAFELFRAGELDTAFLTRPQNWYEKSEIPPVYDGYIERVTFYTRYPKLPLGFYLNVGKPPLDQRDVRVGIAYSVNWQKVIDVIYRGDYQRLNAFNEGFVGFSDPNLRARPYSVSDARAAFVAAGYTEEGNDGILRKPNGPRLEVAVTYPAVPALERVLAILREDARACGLDLRLDGLEPTVAYKKSMQKQHQIGFANYNSSPPLPDFYQFLHSSNAYDEKGNIKPYTNNLFSWARPDTDKLSMQVRSANTPEELRDACRALQHIIHDEAIFIPGYSVDFVRIGSWRWVKWPDSENTRFSPPVVYDPHETFVYWIDENVRKETMDARRSGRTFPESTRVIDAYRTQPNSETTTHE
ncbi:MAG: ABC transporter substrate-binding protein [Luteolibacter sp.]